MDKDFYSLEETLKNDEIYFERLFREKVMDFLYDNNVKLFKSATEGNILIKLTGVSLTPEKTLGRRIYSFTATATEIADNTIDKYNKYRVFVAQENSSYAVLNVNSINNSIL